MLLVYRLTAAVLDNLGDNEVMMVIMPMGMAIIVAHRRRAAGTDMHGRVMVPLKDRSTAPRVVLLRGHLAHITDSEVATEVIVVVTVVGTTTANLLRLLWWSRRHPRRWLLPVRSRICLVRL